MAVAPPTARGIARWTTNKVVEIAYWPVTCDPAGSAGEERPVRTDVVVALERNLQPEHEHERVCRVVSARPERQGCPRASALRASALCASTLGGLDSGLAPTGAPVRQPGAALARRRAQEAANLQNEVAGDRASTSNALEAHRKEGSHEPCCHRSRRQGIADLHPSTGRGDRGRAEGPDSETYRARRNVAGEPGRDGDL